MNKYYTLTISPYFLSILAFFCMVALLVNHQPEYFYGGNQYDVRVINGFTNNSSLPLVIWCWTEKTDMGGRALQEGDDYSWSLKTKPLLYAWAPAGDGGDIFCTMKWDQKRKKFDAFQASRDTHRCNPLKLCLWLVKEDGFYFRRPFFYLVDRDYNYTSS